MPSFVQDVYCCCNVFPVTYGLYLIAFHCLLQGMYGVSVVVTTTHLNLSLIVNFCITISYGLLIPAGVTVLWTNLYESWKGARVSGVAIFILSIANLATACLYFVTYFQFKANSLLDKILFWVNSKDWVDGGDYPFIFWHVLVFFLIFMAPLWWYYAFVLYKYSKLMRHRGRKIKLRLPRSKRPRKRFSLKRRRKSSDAENQGEPSKKGKRRAFRRKSSRDSQDDGSPGTPRPKRYSFRSSRGKKRRGSEQN